MRLDLGGIETIDVPSPEEARHYLKFMPAKSPFVVLEDGADLFVQAVLEDRQYRVEYRDGRRQWFVKTDYERAVELFLCFMDAGCDIGSQVAWKRLSALNTPFHPIAIVLACVLIVAATVIGVLVELGVI